MNHQLTGRLTKGLSVELVHGTGATVNVTATQDFGGEGNLHSPTDLFALSVCACTVISMAYYAKRNKIPLEGVSFSVEEKTMKKSIPSRFTKISLHYKVTTSASDADYKRLIHAAEMCPVRHSIHPEIELIEKFEKVS